MEAKALKNLNIRGGTQTSLAFQSKYDILSVSKLGNLPPSWRMKNLEAIFILLPSVDVLLPRPRKDGLKSRVD